MSEALVALQTRYRRLKAIVDKETASNYDRLIKRIDELEDEVRSLKAENNLLKQNNKEFSKTAEELHESLLISKGKLL